MAHIFVLKGYISKLDQVNILNCVGITVGFAPDNAYILKINQQLV